MRDFSDRITEILLNKGEIKAEDIAIYKYGFRILIDVVVDSAVLLLIGILLHQTLKCLIFMIVFSSVRMYSGGYHARTKPRCIMITCLMLILEIVLSNLVLRTSYYIEYNLAAIVLTYLIMWRKAPIRNENKILEDYEIPVYKNKVLCLITIYATVIVITSIYFWGASVSVSTTLIEVCLLMFVKAGGEKYESSNCSS